MSSRVTGLPAFISGLTAPSATGRREKSTLSGARKMCRCLLCSTSTRKTSITPMCSSRPTLSSTSSWSSESPSKRLPTACDMNAPSPYGRFPAAAAAPRNRNIVQMTLKIMNSTSHAPPRCEPLKRDRRPSRSGALRRRITAKMTMPTSAITAMKSWAKPRRSHSPTSGIDHSRLRVKRIANASR